MSIPDHKRGGAMIRVDEGVVPAQIRTGVG